MKNRAVYENTFGLWPNCHSQKQVRRRFGIRPHENCAIRDLRDFALEDYDLTPIGAPPL
jgi:hypothetical protein